MLYFKSLLLSLLADNIGPPLPLICTHLDTIFCYNNYSYFEKCKYQISYVVMLGAFVLIVPSLVSSTPAETPEWRLSDDVTSDGCVSSDDLVIPEPFFLYLAGSVVTSGLPHLSLLKMTVHPLTPLVSISFCLRQNMTKMKKPWRQLKMRKRTLKATWRLRWQETQRSKSGPAEQIPPQHSERGATPRCDSPSCPSCAQRHSCGKKGATWPGRRRRSWWREGWRQWAARRSRGRGRVWRNNYQIER